MSDGPDYIVKQRIALCVSCNHWPCRCSGAIGSSSSSWRSPSERSELVERLILAEADADLCRRALTEWAEHVEQDPAAGSYVRALLARIGQLEVSVETLSRRVA